MNDLPRRATPPLPPPVGTFEQTLARARARRRKALAGAASATAAACAVVVIAASIAVGHASAGKNASVRIAPPASSATATSASPIASAAKSPSAAVPAATASSVAAPSAAPSASMQPGTGANREAPPLSPSPATTTSGPRPTRLAVPVASVVGSVPASIYHGRLTNVMHQLLRGYVLMRVAPGAAELKGAPRALDADRVVATTDADGTFEVACGSSASALVAVSPDVVARLGQSWVGTVVNGSSGEAKLSYPGGDSTVPVIDLTAGCQLGAGVITTVVP